MTAAGERLIAAAKEMRTMAKIPEDIIKAGRRCYDGLGRGSVSDSEHIARALLAERERCAVEIAALREQLAESDRNAEKLEALLDPHVSWEGEPPAAILAAEKRGEERERERWRRRPYSILEPKGGWRSKEQFSEVERRKLLPIAETLALLDGNAFFTVGAENEWAFSYLPEADAIYQANGGDNGWAGEASFAKPFAAAIRKGSDQ